MPKIADLRYICDRCGGEFDCGWSDLEATKEQETLFPGLPRERQALVCDDCFKIIMGGVQ